MKRTTRLLAVTGLALAVGLALFCNTSESPAAPEKEWKIWNDGAQAPAAAQAVPPGFQPTASFAPLVKRLQPSVVNISTATEVKGRRFYHRGPDGSDDDSSEDLFRRFFGNQFEMPPQRRNSLGSGFVVNPDGYLLTNNHVVEGATEIKVKFTQPDRELKATVVGRDEKYDLALLKVETKDRLPAVSLGDSDAVEVGDWVIAIGSPFGLAHTVTAGIVSAKDRVIGAGPFDDFIQTDASINPGNSGGPLFDASGNVVGINTAIHAAAQGIGFAVPVNMAKQFIRDVLQKGRVSRGWLGVGIQELTPELAQGLKLGDRTGVVVSQVFPGSPADKAGVQRGDVITRFGGRDVNDPAALTRAVGLTEPGRDVEMQVVRDGREVSLKARVVERDEDGGAFERRDGGEPGGDGKASTDLGLELAPLSAREAERLDLKPGQGVKVDDVKPDGPAGETGIRPGDVLMEVNRQPVGSPGDLAAVVAKVRPGDSVLLLVLRDRNYFYAVVRKP